MYFRRFQKESLNMAIADEIINTDEYCLIVEFYECDKMRISEDDLKPLSDILNDKIEILEQNVDNDGIVVLRVLEWPHCKPMCLKYAPLKPCHWKYVDEMDENTLFEYIIDSVQKKGKLIFRPTPEFSDDRIEASGQGSD